MSAARLEAIGLVLAGSLWSGAAAAAGTEPVEAGRAVVLPEAPTRYVLLVERIVTAPPTEQHDFAAIAIDHMLAEYEAALAKVLDERVSDPGGRRKQFRWAGATERFALDLDAQATRLDTGGSTVRVTRGAVGAAYLHFEDVVVVVSSLRLDARGELEAGIAGAFCARHDCTDLEPASDGGAPAPALIPPPAPRAAWSFGDHVPAAFQTDDGLRFEFPDRDDRPRRQAACRRVIEDLRRLVVQLDRAKAAGYTIDWARLGLAPGHPGRVLIDARGTFVVVQLEALPRAPALLDVAREWIRARIEGREHRAVFRAADRPFGLLPGG